MNSRFVSKETICWKPIAPQMEIWTAPPIYLVNCVISLNSDHLIITMSLPQRWVHRFHHFFCEKLYSFLKTKILQFNQRHSLEALLLEPWARAKNGTPECVQSLTNKLDVYKSLSQEIQSAWFFSYHCIFYQGHSDLCSIFFMIPKRWPRITM